MRGCGRTLLDGVRLVSLLSFKLSWHHPCVHPHPERRREKDRGLRNPAFPRDRGDIHERESAGIERQTGTQKQIGREGAQGVYLSPLSDQALNSRQRASPQQSAALCPSATHAASQLGERGMNEWRETDRQGGRERRWGEGGGGVLAGSRALQ